MSECIFFLAAVLFSVHPWPMFQKDLGHTGSTDVNGPAGSSLLWKFSLGSTTSSSPVVAENGTVYIGTNSGYIIAVKPDGSESWRFNTGAPVNAAPAIFTSGDVCAGTSAGELVVVNSAGAEKGRFKASGQFAASSSPIVDGTSIYIASDSNLYCINASTAKQQWLFRTSGSVDASPAKSTNYIYITTWWPGPNYIHSVSSSGSGFWQKEMGGGKSSPTYANQVIYAGSNDSYLYAYNTSGGIAFKKLLGGRITASPAVAPDGRILVGAWDSTFYCLDSKGDILWKFSTKGIIESSAAVDASGTAYFGCADSTVYAVSASGDEKWRYKTGHRIISSPALGADGTLYIGCWDQNLYAIGPGGGLAEDAEPCINTNDFRIEILNGACMKVSFSGRNGFWKTIRLVDVSGRTLISEDINSTDEMYVKLPRSKGVFFVVAENGRETNAKKLVLL
ncbi:PQQ-like beta-propeller repeat protein [bacterium]|nr:PQQ-like beta-propeller repeat protein [bacterium]